MNYLLKCKMVVAVGLLCQASFSIAANNDGDGNLSEPVIVKTKFYSGFGWNSESLQTNAPSVSFWTESSLKRIYPLSLPTRKQTLQELTARNAIFSFQACLRNSRSWPINVECSVTNGDDFKIQVRRVGYVPQWNYTADTPKDELDGSGMVPGLVPDPLFPESSATVGPFATQSFWVTVKVLPDAKVGLRQLKVNFKSSTLTQEVTLPVNVQVVPLVIQPRKNFDVTHWWNADAIYDWYKEPPLGNEWFKTIQPYLNDMLEHGSDVIMVPMLYTRREIVERPPQLLIVNEPEPGKYLFDWAGVKRFVDLAKQIGFNKFEWPHLWSYKVDPAKPSVDTPTRVYTWKNGKADLLWSKEEAPTGLVYSNFLAQFLPEFHDFLAKEDILNSSYFHLSDEPGGDSRDLENYKNARNLLRSLAPWMKVMDAMSDIRYGRDKGLIDIPVPNDQAAQAYVDAGIPYWVYYCMGPRGPYLNRFFDTPLPKIRMSGWVFYRLHAEGFLHWGYNYWYVMDLSFNPKSQVLVDPFTDGAGGTSAGGAGSPYGDCFVVYPGINGPIDSVRWEVFADSLQDYAILQSANISPGNSLLDPIKSYSNYPRSEKWIDETLRTILLRSAETNTEK